jgi:hypothetical protein
MAFSLAKCSIAKRARVFQNIIVCIMLQTAQYVFCQLWPKKLLVALVCIMLQTAQYVFCQLSPKKLLVALLMIVRKSEEVVSRADLVIWADLVIREDYQICPRDNFKISRIVKSKRYEDRCFSNISQHWKLKRSCLV